MKSKPFKCLFALMAVAAVGIAAYFLMQPKQSADEKSEHGEAVKLTSRKPITVKNLAAVRDEQLKKQSPRRVKKKRDRSQIPDDLSAAERATLDSVDRAVNEGNFKEVLRLTEKLGASTNEIARLRAVEALGWFDDAALPELTPFLMDADEGVRDSARDQWMASLGQVENMDLKASVIEATMQTVTDPDLLEDIAFHFNDLPTFTAIDSLVALIEGGNEAAAEMARETYSFLTGSEYSSLDEAQRWVDENVESDVEPEDMPVYRASMHPEVFDETVDLTGIKIINDTDMEIPPRAGAEPDAVGATPSARSGDNISDETVGEEEME